MFDINVLPINLVDGRNLGELLGLKIYSAPRKREATRQDDIVVLMMTVKNREPDFKEYEEWGKILSESYFSARGSFTMGISLAAKKFHTYLKSQYPGLSKPVFWLNMAVIREKTLLIGHAGPVNTTVIFADHVEYYSDENSVPLNESVSGLRFFQTTIHSGDILLMCPEVPYGWTNDAILEATGDSPINVIRYLLDQADGNLAGAVIQFKIGDGNIEYRYRAPVSTKVELAYATNHEAREFQRVDTKQKADIGQDEERKKNANLIATNESGFLLGSDEEKLKPLYRVRDPKEIFPEYIPLEKRKRIPTDLIQSQDAPSSLDRSTQEKCEMESMTSSPPEDIEKIVSNESLTEKKESDLAGETSETETPPANIKLKSGRRANHPIKRQPTNRKRNWLRFLLILICGILIPLSAAFILLMIYTGRGKGTIHRDNVELAVETAKTALSQTEPILQNVSWSKTLEYLDEADRYGSSPASKDLRGQALSELDRLDGGKKTLYQFGMASALPPETKLTQIESINQYIYALDETSGSILRFSFNQSGMILEKDFVCGEGSYPNKKGGEISVGKLIDFVMIPVGGISNGILAAIDKDANLLYCDYFSRNNHAIKLDAPSRGWLKISNLYFSDQALYVMDAKNNSLWKYNYSHLDGFYPQPKSYFGSAAPNIMDAVDFVVYGNYSYFLRESGTLIFCDYTGYIPSCENILAIGDPMEIQVDLTRKHFSKIIMNASPDISLYLMDRNLQTVLNASMKLNFARYIVPDRVKSDKPIGQATGFGIYQSNMLIIAYGGKTYLSVMP